MGNIEEGEIPFDKGRKLSTEAIANSMKTVIGGGDTRGGGAQRNGNFGQFTFVSTSRRRDAGI